MLYSSLRVHPVYKYTRTVYEKQLSLLSATAVERVWVFVGCAADLRVNGSLQSTPNLHIVLLNFSFLLRYFTFSFHNLRASPQVVRWKI